MFIDLMLADAHPKKRASSIVIDWQMGWWEDQNAIFRLRNFCGILRSVLLPGALGYGVEDLAVFDDGYY